MSGKCRLCRKADCNKLVKELEDHSKAERKLKTMYENWDKTLKDSSTLLPAINTIKSKESEGDEIATRMENQLKIIEEIKIELDHMERMEEFKLEKQRDAYRIKSAKAARASLENYDESFLMLPPQLKGHPIEHTLELNKQFKDGSEDQVESRKPSRDKGLEKELGVELAKELRKLETLHQSNLPEQNHTFQDKTSGLSGALEVETKWSQHMAEQKSNEETAGLERSRKLAELAMQMIEHEESARKERDRDEKAAMRIRALVDERMEREDAMRERAIEARYPAVEEK